MTPHKPKLRVMLYIHIDLHKLNAKIVRAKYLAFIEEGFTPEQALALCKQNI